MVGKERGCPAGMDKEDRAIIFKAFLADTVDQSRHRLAGIDRVEQDPFQPRQQFDRFVTFFIWRAVAWRKVVIPEMDLRSRG